MFEFKYEDASKPAIQLIEWKIKKHSKISKGTILFIYTDAKTDQSETDRTL
jgi:hypothetical protein